MYMKVLSRKLLSAVTMCLLACTLVVPAVGTVKVFASEVPSLDEIGSDTNIEEETQKKTTDKKDKAKDKEKNDSDFIDGMKGSMNLSVKDPTAEKIGGKIQDVASVIIQVMCYAITAGLVVRVLIDLAFIGLPFLRSSLANGYMGNPNVAGQQQDMSGMAGGIGGMGGMAGGMGYGRRGMYGGGMMGGINNVGMQNQMGNQMAMQNQPRTGRIQFVSNAALNAVSSESVIGPDGRGNSAFKTYTKDMVIILVATPVLLTLAITGVLADFGFMLGGVIESAIRGINF